MSMTAKSEKLKFVRKEKKRRGTQPKKRRDKLDLPLVKIQSHSHKKIILNEDYLSSDSEDHDEGCSTMKHTWKPLLLSKMNSETMTFSSSTKIVEVDDPEVNESLDCLAELLSCSSFKLSNLSE